MNDDKVKAFRKDGVEILIDLDKCISAGPCSISAPNIFRLRDSDGKAVIDDENGNTYEELLEAVKSCPVSAIKILKNNKQILS